MRETLIVVDMQNDFIDGTLATKEAQAIVSNVAKKIKEYKDAGKQVIFTRDTHPENYLETYEGKHLPVTHCVKNTIGWQISDKLDFDIENDILIDELPLVLSILLNTNVEMATMTSGSLERYGIEQYKKRLK